jgi:hypothetical protein
MRKYYIPSRDTDFRAWVNNFRAVLGTLLATLGLLPADLTALNDAADESEAALEDHIAAQNVAEAKRVSKDEKRKVTEDLVKALVKRIQAAPNCTDEIRGLLNITVPKSDRSKPPVPTARPVIEIDLQEGLMQVVRTSDSETGKRGKPEGTSIEVRMAVLPHGSPVPATAEELPVLTFATASRIEHAFGAGDVCKTAVWGMRYVNSQGEAGPWSTIVTGTIAA